MIHSDVISCIDGALPYTALDCKHCIETATVVSSSLTPSMKYSTQLQRFNDIYSIFASIKL
jgi:hypothetical protein